MITPQSAIKNHSQVPISGEQKIRNHLKAILSDQSILEFVLKYQQAILSDQSNQEFVLK